MIEHKATITDVVTTLPFLNDTALIAFAWVGLIVTGLTLFLGVRQIVRAFR